MKRFIPGTRAMLEKAAKKHGGTYIADLAPAYLETLPDGRMVYDSDHPAWLAMVKKYPPPPKPSPAQRKEAEARQWKIVGPKMWAELHARAQAFAGDVPAEIKWLAGFARRIGCGKCKTHWLAMMAATPPDLAGAAAYYVWTVARHNEVNVRLGNPVWMPSGE